MRERWQRELLRLGDIETPVQRIRSRSDRLPHAEGAREPSNLQRIAAGVLAFAVFLAAAAFGWRAFTRESASGQIDGRWPVATIELSNRGDQRSATLSSGDYVQVGEFGTSSSPDESYPYRWHNPSVGGPIDIPLGTEIRVVGDVEIREILFGDAEQLDAGRGPDSGPISSDQPTFEGPYFPVSDRLEREYWKLFGTWADGSVLDVYFEVRWVEPDVDLTDTSVDIIVTPGTFRADLLYGGQRTLGGGSGSYGNMILTAEWSGPGPDTVYFPVAAGSSIDVTGKDLESWSLGVGPGDAESADVQVDHVPDRLGPTTLYLSVRWGRGEATLRFWIEVVPPASAAEASTDPIRFEESDGWFTASTAGRGVPATAWIATRPFPAGSTPATSTTPEGMAQELEEDEILIVACQVMQARADPTNPNFPAMGLPLTAPGTVESAWEGGIPGKGRSVILAQVTERYLQIWIFFGTPDPSNETRSRAQEALARLVLEPIPSPVDLPEPTQDEFRSEFVSDELGYRFWPRSANVDESVVYRFNVPHCGLDWLVDFDGSFWEPLYAANDGKPSFAVNADTGTIELTGPNEARYASSGGSGVMLVRIDGPVLRSPCD